MFRLSLPEDCKKGVPLLVCLSGGADSVCLLVALLEAGHSCVAAHCNFHLRGEESDRDERFVTELCQRLGVRLVRRDFDTTGYAETKHLSIEMAARELRYRWFEEVRQQENCRYIAVAHNLNDSVETFFLNLTRGTGIKGLTGITPVNGNVIRPLLETTREEIEWYLKQKGESYVTDSTNSDTKYRRNRIRHNILPEFIAMNPSFMETMRDTMRNLASAEASINDPSSPESRAYELYRLLNPLGFTHDRILQVWQAEQREESGKIFEHGDVTVVVNRGEVRIYNRGEYSEGKQRISTSVTEKNKDMRSGSDYAYFDADKVVMPLTLRHWEKGEWFIPYGMKGRKKISDYLTEQKLDLMEKERQKVVVDGQNRIIWVVGRRTDSRFAVDNKTVRVVKVTLEENC